MFLYSDLRQATHSYLFKSLVKERYNIVEEFSGYKTIGGKFVLSDKAVTQIICDLAGYITSIDDLNSIFTLRQEHKYHTFRVIVDVVLCVPHRNVTYHLKCNRCTHTSQQPRIVRAKS